MPFNSFHYDLTLLKMKPWRVWICAQVIVCCLMERGHLQILNEACQMTGCNERLIAKVNIFLGWHTETIYMYVYTNSESTSWLLNTFTASMGSVTVPNRRERQGCELSILFLLHLFSPIFVWSLGVSVVAWAKHVDSIRVKSSSIIRHKRATFTWAKRNDSEKLVSCRGLLQPLVGFYTASIIKHRSLRCLCWLVTPSVNKVQWRHEIRHNCRDVMSLVESNTSEYDWWNWAQKMCLSTAVLRYLFLIKIAYE